MSTRTLVLLLALGALLLPASANAGTFSGKTTQGRSSSLHTDSHGRITSVRISWSANCEKGHFNTATFIRRPRGQSGRRRLKVVGTYLSPQSNGVRSKVLATLTLRRTVVGGRPRWSGTWVVIVSVRRNSRFVDRCSPKPIGLLLR